MIRLLYASKIAFFATGAAAWLTFVKIAGPIAWGFEWG